MRKEDIFKKNHVLGVEFDRYVLEHPEFLEELPEGAEIIFLPEDDADLCKENLKIAKLHTEDGRPIIFVKIEKLAPYHSRLVNVRIEKAAVQELHEK